MAPELHKVSQATKVALAALFSIPPPQPPRFLQDPPPFRFSVHPALRPRAGPLQADSRFKQSPTPAGDVVRRPLLAAQELRPRPPPAPTPAAPLPAGAALLGGAGEDGGGERGESGERPGRLLAGGLHEHHQLPEAAGGRAGARGPSEGPQGRGRLPGRPRYR